MAPPPIVVFEISGNKLSATIPESFASMVEAQELELQRNKLSGFDPCSCGQHEAVKLLVD